MDHLIAVAPYSLDPGGTSVANAMMASAASVLC